MTTLVDDSDDDGGDDDCDFGDGDCHYLNFWFSPFLFIKHFTTFAVMKLRIAIRLFKALVKYEVVDSLMIDQRC